MGTSLNKQANGLLDRCAAEQAARARDKARTTLVGEILNSLPTPEGGLDAMAATFRKRFEAFLEAVFDSGITGKTGWLTLPQVSDLLEYGRFDGTDLTPDTRALVFADHGFAPGNVKGVFSRVGLLSDKQDEEARLAMEGMPGADCFSGWKMPRDVGEVLRPVLTAVAHGKLIDNGDSAFAHFEDPNFSEFDGGTTRRGRSEWVAADKLVGVARLETLAANWPDSICPFFSKLRYQEDANRGDTNSTLILENPPLFR